MLHLNVHLMLISVMSLFFPILLPQANSVYALEHLVEKKSKININKFYDFVASRDVK